MMTWKYQNLQRRTWKVSFLPAAVCLAAGESRAAKAKAVKVKQEKPQHADRATKPSAAAGVGSERGDSPGSMRSGRRKSGSQAGALTGGDAAKDVLDPEGRKLDSEMQKVQNKLGAPFQVALVSLDPARTRQGLFGQGPTGEQRFYSRVQESRLLPFRFFAVSQHRLNLCFLSS